MNSGKVQVEIRTIQDADLTKSGENLGQYKVIFLTKLGEFADSASRSWDSIRRCFDKIRIFFGTVQGYKLMHDKVNLTHT